MTSSPTAKNARQKYSCHLLPPPDSPLLARGRCCPKIKRKQKGRKVLSLISFELGHYEIS